MYLSMFERRGIMAKSPIQVAAHKTPPHMANRLKGLSDRTIAWIFVAPTIFLLLAVNIFPLIWTIRLSFTNYRVNRPNRDIEWVGLRNYERILSDPDIWNTMQATAHFLIWTIVLQVLIGFTLAFMPLYVLGLMGVTRRLSQFEDTAYAIYFNVALVGALFVALGIAAFFIQIAVSIMKREELRDHTGDPWGGRTLEWATSSPPPYYNFAFTPRVYALDAWDHMKRNGYERPRDGYVPIHMPHYTSTGIVISGLLTVMGFALIWHVWWLALISFAGALAWGIGHTFNYNRDYYVPADEVRAIETASRPNAAPAE